jgi:chromate transporter
MKDFETKSWLDIVLALVVMVATWAMLNYTRLPSPVIVLIWLALGWVFMVF